MSPPPPQPLPTKRSSSRCRRPRLLSCAAAHRCGGAGELLDVEAVEDAQIGVEEAASILLDAGPTGRIEAAFWCSNERLSVRLCSETGPFPMQLTIFAARSSRPSSTGCDRPRRRRNDGRVRQIGVSDAPLDDRFARFAATGDEALRNELVLEHQGLAIASLEIRPHRARQRSRADRPRGADPRHQPFRPEREVRFSTYAARVIDGRLKQHFRDDGWDIRVPRSIKQLAVAVRSTTGELTNELGRVPSPAELADRLGVTVDQIALARRSQRPPSRRTR